MKGVRTLGALLPRLLVAALWLSGGGAVSPAYAQAPERAASEEPTGYRATVEEALQEFEARNFEESRALFARAHALYPNARTLRGLGFAEFELRHYAECIERLEEALRSQVKPLEGTLREDTERLLARANNFVARVFIDVKPSRSQLRLDGTALDVGAGQPVLLQIGAHTLEVQAPGFKSERRSLRVQGGEDQRVNVLLEAEPAVEVAEAPRRRWYKSPWLWGTLGVVALGAVGTTLGLTLGGTTKHERADGGSADAVLMGPTR